MRVLKSKDGFAYIMICVIVIVAMMLLMVGLQYRQIFYVADMQQASTQLKVDQVMLHAAKDHYDALKQGSAYEGYIDDEKIVEETYEALGFSDAEKEKHISNSCTMLQPYVEAIDENGFGVKVTYELQIPFSVLDRYVTDITVPVEIYSMLKKK